MSAEKAMSMLGLAQRAGKLASGDQAVQKAVKGGRVHLLLVASDASPATRKSYRDMAAFYEVECRECLSKSELAACIGKGDRAAVAVIDRGFAQTIRRELAPAQ